MNNLSDILLKKPLSDALLQGLLFTSFTLHMLFVLLTIGTAILALSYFIHAWCGRKFEELRWDKEILRTFLVHKSLAVVLGVAPLLLIQVGFTIPFFTAVNLVASFWMLIIPLLMIAFLLFDALGHRIEVHPCLHLALGMIALISLLVVPGIFVASLIIAENPGAWVPIVRKHYQLSGPLAIHWLFRYLHVLGAGIVFGAAFHYLFLAKGESERQSSLLKWIVAGLLFQFVLGIMLYTSLPEKPDDITHVSLIAGILAAGILLWVIYFKLNKSGHLGAKVAVTLFMLILVPMLLTRQFVQNRNLLPFTDKLRANAVTYAKELEPYSQEALNRYKSDLEIIYDKGDTIYLRSCAFCHGENGDGKGSEAKNLEIPPENLSSIRTSRAYFETLLVEGVPGSAMPYFTFFDRDRLANLFAYLDEKYRIASFPEASPVKISDSGYRKAEGVYTQICSTCHGPDGKGSKFSQGFKPKPEDFTVYNLSPRRGFDIITNGYPGTAMPPFSGLPEGVRWGLVRIVNGFYQPSRI